MHVNTRYKLRQERRARTRRLGRIHESGKNRAQRRREEVIERQKPQDLKAVRMSDHYDLQKAQKMAAIERKHAAAHQRALERAKTRQPSILTRARRQMQAILQRRVEAKRQRQIRYNLKTHPIGYPL